MVNTMKKKTIPNTQSKPKLAILASGTGTLFEAITQACFNHQLNAEVVTLISDRKQAPVITKAQNQNIPVKIFRIKDYPSLQKWDQNLCTYLKTIKPDLIVLAGFLKKLKKNVLHTFKNKILNIHPSLLPLHGGKGMYGIHVHKSVLRSGDKHTGVSVHLVTENYDTGPVLAQKKIALSPNETPETLQKKIKNEEKKFYISVLKKIIKNPDILSKN